MKFFKKQNPIHKKIKNFLKLLNSLRGKSFFALIATAVFLIALFFYQFATSSALQNLSGYAWGADQVGVDPVGGMGWLSLNCISGGNCGTADYGVNIDPDGYIRGYAWSSNYGWVRFGGLPATDFPTGGGTVADNAKVNWAAPDPKPITGWARFCSASANPDTCTGFVPNLRNGGWDGKISLSGSAPTYGLFLNSATGTLTGYAWGGNCVGGDAGTDGDCQDAGEELINVGWIDFSDVIYTPVVSPTVTLSVTPGAILAGSTTTLNWTGLNIEAGPNACMATGDWAGVQSYPPPAGGVTVGPFAPGTYNFSIQCFGAGNTPSNISTAQLTVGSNGVLDFYASPSPVYPPFQTTLYWNSLPSGELDTCVADSAPPLNIAPIASWNGPVLDPSSSSLVTVPYNPTNFKLTCKDSLGQDVSATVSVPQGTLPETVTLSSNGVSENPAGSGNYYTTLSWSTINANNCVASGGAGGPPWQGGKGNSGSEPNVPVVAVPPISHTYTLTCTGIYSFETIVASLDLNIGSGRTFTIKQPLYKEQ